MGNAQMSLQWRQLSLQPPLVWLLSPALQLRPRRRSVLEPHWSQLFRLRHQCSALEVSASRWGGPWPVPHNIELMKK